MTISREFAIKAGWWDASLVFRNFSRNNKQKTSSPPLPPLSLPPHQTKCIPSWASTLVPHLDLTCHPLTYIFNNDIAITLHLLPHSSSSRCCRNSNNWYFGGNPTVSTIAQRSYNHLVILKHRHNNNKRNYNNIQNIQHLCRYSKKW